MSAAGNPNGCATDCSGSLADSPAEIDAPTYDSPPVAPYAHLAVTAYQHLAAIDPSNTSESRPTSCPFSNTTSPWNRRPIGRFMVSEPHHQREGAPKDDLEPAAQQTTPASRKIEATSLTMTQ